MSRDLSQACRSCLHEPVHGRSLIAGGEPLAAKRQFPYLVSLQTEDGVHVCGGAHCARVNVDDELCARLDDAGEDT